MTPTRTSIAAFFVAAALAASACGSGSNSSAASTAPAATTAPAASAAPADSATTVAPSTAAPDSAAPGTAAPATTATAPDGTDAPPSSDDPAPPGGKAGAEFTDEANRAALENIADGYRNSVGIWKGFDLAEHPVVLAVRDADDKLLGAIAINHSAPDKLGDATAVDTSGMPFTSAHTIKNPVDADKLTSIPTFEFNTDLGGVDSFVMVAGGADGFFDPLTKDYVSTLIHEMFHRYQGFNFKGETGQDVEGYAYTKENLELAVLEERALAAAVTAENSADRDAAAKRFAALRLARLAADPRVALDNDQETGEGTARYLEHRLSADKDGYVYNSTNFDRDLITEFANASEGIKEIFGFGRWYASGAAVLHLLDELGVENKEARIEAGEKPADMLATALGVTKGDTDALVAEARTTHDPKGELAEQAAAAEEKAKGEGAVFGDSSDG